MTYDLILKNGKIVIPRDGVFEGDIAIEDGKVAALGRDIPNTFGDRTVDVKGKVVLPGVVDAHSHMGIYRPLDQDAKSESTAAVTGGITTVLNIIRPRPYYLNMKGPLMGVFQKLVELSKGAYLTDYGYALAPVERAHLRELRRLVNSGVSTFKFFMHYRDFKFSDEPYDTGFLFDLMREVAKLNNHVGSVRVSLHCEDPEIIRVMGQTGYGLVLHRSARAERRPVKDINPLKLYSAARPPLSEAMAIAKAIQLADNTGCPINILHVTSELAINTATGLLHAYRNVDATVEVAVHHLVLTTDSKAGVFGKVNPPIREKGDVEALWNAIAEERIQVVVSDHAATPLTLKQADVWSAIFGFGGNTLLCPLMISEGYHKRGLPLTRIAELISYNPAKIHGFYPRKGTIMVGADADLTVVDMKRTQKVTAELLNSAQEFTPFDGMNVTGWPQMTLVRGRVMFEDGAVTGRPGHGEYVKRPVAGYVTAG